jgi:hypothetical protein
MKRVVKTQPKSEIITLNKVKDESYVGIKWSSGSKSWVTQSADKEFKGTYIGDQNLMGCWTRPTKREYVGNAMEQDGTEVYVFDNRNELLTFLLDE